MHFNQTLSRAGIIFFIGMMAQFVALGQNCTVNAGTPTTYCNVTSFTLNGKQGGSVSPTPNRQWTQVGGSPALTIVNPGDLNTAVTGVVPGVFVFRLSVQCSDGVTNFNDVTITILPTPTQAQAGPDQEVCSGLVQLAGNVPGSGQTGKWSIVSGSGTFSNNSSPTSQFTPGGTAGVYQLKWTITNNYCKTEDEVTIRVLGGQQPVSAGPDQTLTCKGSTTTLAGTDPGLSPQAGLWTLESGPNTPIISNASSFNTGVGGLIPGTYTFKWTVSGPCFSGNDLVQIIVNDIRTSPNVGGSKTLTFCQTDNVTSALLVAAPLGSGETGVWDQTQGPLATIVSPNTPTTQITGMNSVSQYRFRWTATNSGGCVSPVNHTVIFVPDLSSLSTPPDQTLACQANTATVNFTYNYGGITSTSGFTRNGKLISSPLTVPSNVSLSRAGSVGNDTWTINNMDTAGLYTFQFEYRNACGASFRNVSILVSDTAAIPNGGADVLLPCNASTTQLVAADVPLAQGTGSWSQVAGPAATIANPNATVTDVDVPVEGVYVFRWNIQNGPACSGKGDEIQIVKSSLDVVEANAGNDSTICAGPFVLKANLPGPTQTGTWSGIPGNVSISNINAPNATLTGLLPGQVLNLTWTISNACDQSADVVVLTVNNDYSIAANGGPDQCLPSGTTQVQLTGNNPGVGVPFWTSLDGAPLNSTILQNPTATIPSDGTYRFVYNILNPGCNINTDTVLVTISAPTTVANAGPNQDICENALPIATVLAGNAPSSGTGIWKQVIGNAGPVIASPLLPNSAVSNLQVGIYEFEWSISNGACPTTKDTVRIVAALAPQPVDAGPNQSVCDVTTSTQIQLAGTAVINGTGVWTVVSGPSGSAPVFSDVTSPTSTVRNLQNGTYVLQWNTVSNPGCPVFTDQVTLFVTARAEAGPNTSNACDVTTVTLTGNVNTDGTWALLSTPVPPNTPTIDNDLPTLNAAIVSGMITGTYVFQYTLPAVGACPATSDNITVNIQQSPTVAAAGADVALCPGTTSTSLTGNTPLIGTPKWTRKLSPNTPGETGINSPTLSLTSLVPGVYEYEYSITSGSCPVSTDNVFVIVANAADAGPNQAFCGSGPTGNATTLNGNLPVFYTGNWTQQSGPNTANILLPNSNTTGVTGMVPGIYTFRWTINTPGGCGANFDEVTVQIDAPLSITGLAGPDQSKCEGPGDLVLGSASGPLGASYVWLPATLLSDATVLQPNFTGTGAGSFNYTLFATRGTCIATDGVTVTVTQVPVQPVLSGPTNLCENATTTVSVASVQAGVTYNWSGGLGTGTSKVVGPGTYTVTPVFNIGGCTGQPATITITADLLPTVANAGSDVGLCQNITSVTLNGNVPLIGNPVWSRRSGPNTPSIDPPGANNTSITLQGLVAGTYIYRYTISNGTCPSSFDEVQIQKERVANAGNDQRLCNATSASLSANVPVIYPGQWTQVSKPAGAPDVVFTNPSSPTTTVSGLSFGTALSGSYVLAWTIESGGACAANTDEVTIVVDAPVNKPEAGDFYSKCANDPTPVVLGVNPQAGVVYSWSPAANLGNPNAFPTTFVGTTPGRYDFVVTGTNNSCSNFDNVTVTINPVPAQPLVSVPSPICANTTALATVTNADPDVTYDWYSGPNFVATGPSVSLAPGTYEVRATSNFGCVGVVSNPVVIGAIPVPPPPVVVTSLGGINDCGIVWEVDNPNAIYNYVFALGNDPRRERVRTGPGPHEVNYFTAGPKTALVLLRTPDGCTVSTLANAPAACAVLPLQLVDFKGTWPTGGPLLHWKATNIQQFSHFEIERSYNGQTFEQVGKIAVAANITEGVFEFKDKGVSPAAGVVYYQLKMVDRNGRFTYSNVQQLGRAQYNKYSVSPNPFGSMLIVDANTTKAGKANLSLLGVSGNVILTRQVVLEAGFNRISIEGLGYVLPGQYLLRIATDKEIQHVKVQKY